MFAQYTQNNEIIRLAGENFMKADGNNAVTLVDVSYMCLVFVSKALNFGNIIVFGGNAVWSSQGM